MLAVACSHAPPPLHSTPLIVMRGKGGVFPFVRAKVAGHPVTLLLDTGAVRSILPSAFGRAHNLATATRARDEYTVDANGNMVQMSVLPNVPVQFEGESEAGKLDFFLNPSAAGTTQGILAPQDVVRSGWALVIDFRHETLKHEPEELALEHVRAESPQLRELDVSGCPSQALFDRHHRIVPAMINGVETKMLVDTGASTTAIARNNPALASMIKMQGNRATTVMVTCRLSSSTTCRSSSPTPRSYCPSRWYRHRRPADKGRSAPTCSVTAPWSGGRSPCGPRAASHLPRLPAERVFAP